MSRSKILLALLIVSNLGWFVAHLVTQLDIGLTVTYHEASLDTSQKMLDQAIIIANENLIGVPLADAMDKLGQDTYGLDPFINEGCLYAGGLCLEINSNGVIGGLRTK